MEAPGIESRMAQESFAASRGVSCENKPDSSDSEQEQLEVEVVSGGLATVRCSRVVETLRSAMNALEIGRIDVARSILSQTIADLCAENEE